MPHSTGTTKHSNPHSSLKSDREHDTDPEICSADESSDDERVEVVPNLPSDYESASTSSDKGTQDPSFGSLRAERRSTYTPTRSLNRQGRDDDNHDSQHEARQRAWYEFDLAVILVLVSPIGNWLTGGDHVKNLVFLALLVFYLRQVTEVPWMLYEKARCPRRPPHLSIESAEDKYRELAFSELRKFELVYLALTAISPFAGAYLLRYVTTAILGSDSISWFSTGLFVMASGMRPWSHLVDRLSQRASDLQDFVRHPKRPGCDDDVHGKIETLMKRIDGLEQSLVGIHAQQDVAFDHLDFRLTSMKRSVRKRERRWDELKERVRSIEESVAARSASGSGQKSVSDEKKSQSMTVSNITSTAARRVFDLLPTRSFSSTLEEGPRPLRRHTVQPVLGSSISRRANAIDEEEDKRYPLWACPLRFTATILHGIGYVVFMPLRVATRVVFGHH